MNGNSDNKSSNKKDIVWVQLSGFSESVMETLRTDETLNHCLDKVQVGVMVPSGGIEHDYDHARCVGDQKLVGF